MAKTKALKIKRGLTLAVAILLLAGFIGLYLTFGKELLTIVSDANTFKAWLESFNGLDKLVFVSIRALQTVVKIIPAEPLEIGSGYAYGVFGGLALCMLGTLIGSLFIIIITKVFGTKAVELFVPIDKLKDFAFLNDQKRFKTMLFILYLIPGTPKDLITYFIGFTPINTGTFLLITSIARIPSIITSTWCGSELGNKNYLFSAIIFVATAVLGFAGMFIYKKYTDSHKVNKELISIENENKIKAS